jgi:hypothetical protein
VGWQQRLVLPFEFQKTSAIHAVNCHGSRTCKRSDNFLSVPHYHLNGPATSPQAGMTSTLAAGDGAVSIGVALQVQAAVR